MKPRPDLPLAERQGLAAAFARAIRAIPSVRGVRIGRRITFGAGYETRSPDAADFLVIVDFDDLAGLQVYLRHPAHEELGARFNQWLGSAMVYDFETGGPEELDWLVG